MKNRAINHDNARLDASVCLSMTSTNNLALLTISDTLSMTIINIEIIFSKIERKYAVCYAHII